MLSETRHFPAQELSRLPRSNIILETRLWTYGICTLWAEEISICLCDWCIDVSLRGLSPLSTRHLALLGVIIFDEGGFGVSSRSSYAIY